MFTDSGNEQTLVEKLDASIEVVARITSDRVKYDVVDSYGKLMQLVM